MSRLLLSTLLSFLSVASLLSFVRAGTPAPAQYFPDQVVDHLSEDDERTWTQRYYVWDKNFQGPGSPIFVIMGGEGAITPERGLYYPFITHHLSKTFGGFVLEPEHRFYGFSQPITREEVIEQREKDGEDPRVKLFTSEQALMDAMKLIRYFQTDVLKCSLDKFSEDYCPVITVGGSYPGFLSAMARLVFPHVIDIAYSASAPMKFYSQQVDGGAYYEKITSVADKSLPGCAAAVKETLQAVYDETTWKDHNEAEPTAAQETGYIPALELGVCPGTIPHYISSREIFFEEIFMVTGYSFANDNMANYPPDDNTRLHHACQTFINKDLTPAERLKSFLVRSVGNEHKGCFDMSKQLPTGANATISGGDWSGDGTGPDGESWDFQTCTLLVENIGFSEASMFVPREWTMEWMNQHCRSRFGVIPRPVELLHQWKFDEDSFRSGNTTRILFTNGMNDGWSVAGFHEDISESLLVINFENGAHHSDLSGIGPSDRDTDDIRQGFIDITAIFSSWLGEIQSKQLSN